MFSILDNDVLAQNALNMGIAINDDDFSTFDLL